MNKLNTIDSVISLNLTEEEASTLFLKATRAGLSVPELLENFISDLTSSERRNGSDECMLASEWFERCWFAFDYGREISFTKWLADCGELETAFDAIAEIDAIKAELEAPEGATPEELEADKKDLKSWEKDLEDLLQEYTTGEWLRDNQTTQDRAAALEDLRNAHFHYLTIVKGAVFTPPLSEWIKNPQKMD